jgi:hypothetical protein
MKEGKVSYNDERDMQEYAGSYFVDSKGILIVHSAYGGKSTQGG